MFSYTCLTQSNPIFYFKMRDIYFLPEHIFCIHINKLLWYIYIYPIYSLYISYILSYLLTRMELDFHKYYKHPFFHERVSYQRSRGHSTTIRLQITARVFFYFIKINKSMKQYMNFKENHWFFKILMIFCVLGDGRPWHSKKIGWIRRIIEFYTF